MRHHLYFASCVPDGGIYHYLLENGKMKFREKTACDRPMYLELEGDQLHVLLRAPVEGQAESVLVTYPVLKDGSLGNPGTFTNTRGKVACHLSTFHGNQYVANYTSGSVFSTNGSLFEPKGVGVDPARQEGSHLHYVFPAPDQKCLLAVDLGLDAIYVCDEQLRVLGTAHVPAGCGPRHLAYSEDGRIVFCANELGSSVSVFTYEDKQLTCVETVSTLHEPSPENYPAAIRVQGDLVYVSNRGDDSIACFRWGGEHLTLQSVTPCGGRYPRDFLLVEDFLFCTNEKGGCVTVLRVEQEKLTPVMEPEAIPDVLCVVAWAEQD